MKAYTGERLKVEISSSEILIDIPKFESRQKVDSVSNENMKFDREILLCRLEEGKIPSFPSCNMTSFSESRFLPPLVREKGSETAAFEGPHPYSSGCSPPPTKAPHSSPTWHQHSPSLSDKKATSITKPCNNLLYQEEITGDSSFSGVYLEYDFSCDRWNETKEGVVVDSERDDKGIEASSRNVQGLTRDEQDSESLEHVVPIASLMTPSGNRRGGEVTYQERRVDTCMPHRRHSYDADRKAVTKKRLDTIFSFKFEESDNNAGSSTNKDGQSIRGNEGSASSLSIVDENLNERNVRLHPSMESGRKDSISNLREQWNVETQQSDISAFESTSQEFMSLELPMCGIDPFQLATSYTEMVRSNSTGSAGFEFRPRGNGIIDKVQSFISHSKHTLKLLNPLQQGQYRDEKLERLHNTARNLKGRRIIQSIPESFSAPLSTSQHILTARASVDDSQRYADIKKILGNRQVSEGEPNKGKFDPLIGLRQKHSLHKNSFTEVHTIDKSSKAVTSKTSAQKSLKASGGLLPLVNASSPRTSSASRSTMFEMKSGLLEIAFGGETLEYSLWMDDSKKLFTKMEHKDLFEVGDSVSNVFSIFSLSEKEARRNRWTNRGQRKPNPMIVASVNYTTSVDLVGWHENGRLRMQSAFVLHTQAEEVSSISSGSFEPRLSVSSAKQSGTESPRSYQRSLTCPSSPKLVGPAINLPLLPMSCELPRNLLVDENSESDLPSAGRNSVHSALHRFSISRFTKSRSHKEQLLSKPSGELAAIVIELSLERQEGISNYPDNLPSESILNYDAAVPRHRRVYSNVASKLMHAAYKEIKHRMYRKAERSMATSQQRHNASRRPQRIKSFMINNTNHIGGNRLRDGIGGIGSESTLSWDDHLSSHSNPPIWHDYSGEKIADTNATIILPAGEHSYPEYGLPGPQPLIDRWKSDGKCDCGNWDLGCGLIVLDNHSQEASCRVNYVPGSKDCAKPMEQERPLEFFHQGRESRMPALVLSPMHEGQFSLRFQPSISSLQAFSTAIGILHSKFELIKMASMKERLELLTRKSADAPLHHSEVFQSPLPSSGSKLSTGEPKARRNASFSQGHHLDPPFYPIERV